MAKSSSLSYDERVSLTRRVFRILESWEVPLVDSPRLLGLDPHLKRRELNRYRLGSPLPDERGIYRRVASLLEIEHAVGQLFPHSTMSASLWVTTPLSTIGGNTPLALMLERGEDGMRMVLRVLNSQDWW